MLTEVMEHYRLVREFRKAGYFETERQKQFFKEIAAAIHSGRMVALTGIIGCGKTLTLRRLWETLEKEGRITVSKSLSVEKDKATLSTLIAALFFDLSPDKNVKVPGQGEKRERELRDLIKKSKKPVALFVDEAHDLHAKTLTGIKRLIEVVEDRRGHPVRGAGHPKLKNDLRRPTMEEKGYRAAVFTLDDLIGPTREYSHWLLTQCLAGGTGVEEAIKEEALDLLAGRLKTPLQIEQHLTLAFEAGFEVGTKPVTAEIVESILSKQIDDLEPRLTRHGYDVRSLAERFDAKPAEIRSLFRGELDVKRARDLQDQMLAAGLPL